MVMRVTGAAHEGNCVPAPHAHVETHVRVVPVDVFERTHEEEGEEGHRQFCLPKFAHVGFIT